MGTLEAIGSAFIATISFPAIFYMFVGIFIGIIVGFVPGIGGTAAMALMLPFVFKMTPAAGLAFLLSMHAIVQTSNTPTAVLFNIPGSMGASATLFDGHPMALKGEAGRALGAGYMSSILGGLIGAVFLFLSVPIFRPLVLAFSYPDFFLLLLWGVLVAGMAGGVSIPKILASAFLGVMFGLIGSDPLSGVPRYCLGTIYLIDKIPVLSFCLGIFAIPEIMDLAVKRVAIAGSGTIKTITGVRVGIRDTLQNWPLVVRSSLIGVVIGFIPGLGSWVSSFVAYGQAAKTVKNPDFGNGDVRGVIAPESANNATEGGALIPTIMFGVPGSPVLLILLGAFLIFGIQPGPAMVTKHLDLTFVMVITLVLSNVIGGAFLIAIANKTALISLVRSSLLIPIIITLCFLGAYMSSTNFADLLTLMFFGLIGYALRHLEWSMLSFMLGYIFATEGERHLYASLSLFGVSGFFGGSITIVLLFLILVTFVIPITHSLWKKNKMAASKEVLIKKDGHKTSLHISLFNIEVLFCLFVAVLFIAFLFMTFPLPSRAQPFPLIVIIGGLISTVFILITSLRHNRSIEAIAKSLNIEINVLGPRLRNIVSWLFAYLAFSWLLGVQYTLPLVSFLYLKFQSRENMATSIIITASLVALIFGVFDHLLLTYWIEGKLFTLLSPGF